MPSFPLPRIPVAPVMAAACLATVTALTVPSPTLAADGDTLSERVVAVQQEFVAGALAYEKAVQEATSAKTVEVSATRKADRAQQIWTDGRTELARFAASIHMQDGLGDDQPVIGLITIMTGADPDQALRAQQDLRYLSDLRGRRVAHLLTVRDAAESARQEAAAAAKAAEAARVDAAGILDEIQARADVIAAEMETLMATRLDVDSTSVEQETLNRSARQAWDDYLSGLKRAGIELPLAAALSDPDALPDGFTPVTSDGQGVPGAAQTLIDGAPVTVASREAATSVTAALGWLGKPYVPGQSGPDAFDCGGLTATAWARGGVTLSPAVATQWVTGKAVPAGTVQAGDLVFLSDRESGLHHVGVAVNGSMMVAASSDTFLVGAAMIPDTVFGVVRPTVQTVAVNALPGGDGSLTCGSANRLPSLDGSSPDAAWDGVSPIAPPSRAGRAWGGYSNGLIPSSALCPVVAGAGLLRCDAAPAFEALNTVYRAAFKTNICVTDSYRSYPNQIRVFRDKPHLAAVPGTSNHGWGLALDLGCGINTFGTKQHEWMRANAPKFGFVHPQWARRGGTKPEPWHWEYGRIS